MMKGDKRTGKEDVLVIAKKVNKEPGRTAKIVGIPMKIGIGMTVEAEAMIHTAGNNTALGADKNIETDATSATGK